jgi:hypothetical protein
MPLPLDLLANLLQHEANELVARAQSVEIPDHWKNAFKHQARGIELALSFVRAIQSGVRPGASGRSLGAHHFHDYGELLPIGSAECFASKAPEIRKDDGTQMKFYAVHDLESDEFSIAHLRGVTSVAAVCNNDSSLHGDSC